MSETQLKNYNNKTTDLVSQNKKAGKGPQLGKGPQGSHRIMTINLFDMEVAQANKLKQLLSRTQKRKKKKKRTKWTASGFLVSHVNTATH